MDSSDEKIVIAAIKKIALVRLKQRKDGRKALARKFAATRSKVFSALAHDMDV